MHVSTRFLFFPPMINSRSPWSLSSDLNPTHFVSSAVVLLFIQLQFSDPAGLQEQELHLTNQTSPNGGEFLNRVWFFFQLYMYFI